MRKNEDPLYGNGKAALLFILFMESVYKLTTNPYAVWYAFRIARVNNIVVPEWVESYLDTASELLLRTLAPTKEDIPLKVSKALDISKEGPGGISESSALKYFLAYFYPLVECLILFHFGKKERPEIKTMHDIFSTVAEKHNITESVLNKRYYQHRNVYLSMIGNDSDGIVLNHFLAITMIRHPLLVEFDSYDIPARFEQHNTALP